MHRPAFFFRGGGGGARARMRHYTLRLHYSKGRKMHVIALNCRLFDVYYDLFKVIFNKKCACHFTVDHDVFTVTVLIKFHDTRNFAKMFFWLSSASDYVAKMPAETTRCHSAAVSCSGKKGEKKTLLFS